MESPRGNAEHTPMYPVRLISHPFTENYKVLEELHSNLASNLLKVRQRQTSRIRAARQLKMVNKAMRNRARQMLSVFRRIQHSNLPAVLECFCDSTDIHIVTEYCSGGTVLARLVSQQTLMEQQVAHYVKQAASALAYLHSCGIMHRTLRPCHLLLEDSSEESPLKLAGLNRAAEFTPGKCCTERVGELEYMAPEMIKGKYTEKCDVWGLGITMYVLLIGTLPFQSSAHSALRKLILKKQVSFNEELSSAAKSLLEALLDKNPKKRPSMESVLEHPWLQCNHAHPEQPIAPGALQRLSEFSVHSATQRSVLKFLRANEKHHSQLETFQKILKTLDVHRRGTFFKYELKFVAGKVGFNVSTLLQRFPANRVALPEFCAAVADWQHSIEMNYLQKAFESLDSNHDGTISVEELKQAVCREKIDKVMQEADKDGDGTISFEEFCEYIAKDTIV